MICNDQCKIRGEDVLFCYCDVHVMVLGYKDKDNFGEFMDIGEK